MTQMLSPRNRPKPPTIASSSLNLRSPANGDELRDQRVDVVEAMRPLRMAGDLRLLPRRQLGVEVAQRLRRLGFEPADVVGDVGRVAAGLHRAQFLDLGLELGHRFFKVEIAAHLRENAASGMRCHAVAYQAETGL